MNGRFNEAEIEKVMREFGVDRGEAGVIVGMRHGDLVNDIVIEDPLTGELRPYPRSGKTLRQVMIELGELDDKEV